MKLIIENNWGIIYTYRESERQFKLNEPERLKQSKRFDSKVLNDKQFHQKEHQTSHYHIVVNIKD